HASPWGRLLYWLRGPEPPRDDSRCDVRRCCAARQSGVSRILRPRARPRVGFGLPGPQSGVRRDGCGRQTAPTRTGARMSGQLRTAGDGESRSLLIVDDDAGFRSFVVTTLAWVDLGVTLREAASGEDALLLARIDPPSLVMLDVCLPGISGFEICRELREQCGAELPIILVSGTRVDALDRSAGLLIG